MRNLNSHESYGECNTSAVVAGEPRPCQPVTQILTQGLEINLGSLALCEVYATGAMKNQVGKALGRAQVPPSKPFGHHLQP